MLQSLYQFLVESLGTQAGLTVVSSAAIVMIVGLIVIIFLVVAFNNVNSANKTLRDVNNRLSAANEKQVEESETLINAEKQRVKTLSSQLIEKGKEVTSINTSLKLAEQTTKDLQALNEKQGQSILEKDALLEQRAKLLTAEEDRHKETASTLSAVTVHKEVLEEDVVRKSYLVDNLFRAFMFHTKKTKNAIQYYAYTFDTITLIDGTTKVLALAVPYEKLIDAIKKVDPLQPIPDYVDTVQSGHAYTLNIQAMQTGIRQELGWTEDNIDYQAKLISCLGIDPEDVESIGWNQYFFASTVHNRSLSTKLILTSQPKGRNQELFNEFYAQVVPYIKGHMRNAETTIAFHGDIGSHVNAIGYTNTDLFNVEDLIKHSTIGANM